MAATAASSSSSNRAEVDTSSAFRSVKEAVAMFGERLLVRETQFRPNAGGYSGRRGVRDGSSRLNTIAASYAKLEGGDGVRFCSQSKPSAIGANAKHGESSGKLAPSLVSDAAPMYLVPSSPPFFASSPSPSLANDDEAGDVVVMSSIKKVEEEAAKARQEVVQLKRRLAEMELAMATLSAKLHRALSKLAHMEADRAAAERTRIQRRDGRDMALTVWAAAEQRRRRHPGATRQPLGQLLRLGEADGEVQVVNGQRRTVAPTTSRRKVQKQKPIVPLVVPLINGILFSKKKRINDKESFCHLILVWLGRSIDGAAAEAAGVGERVPVGGGGGYLVLYLALPPAETPHWLPIAGLALVAFPWAFWIATCAYRCCRSSSWSSPGEANQRVERQPSSRPAAVAPLPTSSKSLKSAVRSPTASSGGTRRVHFGDATVLGVKGGGGGGGEAAVEEQDDCSSVTSHESEAPLTQS
ncbi:hypothetical protein ABZP36_011496 [Zizania latifolia]